MIENQPIFPNCLYHYTTLNTLDLILKNKTIRFNSLANVDDLSEPLYNNKSYGKYFLVSCWTEASQEMLEMWKTYSDDMTGVRIKLDLFPFRQYKMPEQIKLGENTVKFASNHGYIPIEDIFGSDYVIFDKLTLRPVKYLSKLEVDRIRVDDILGQKDYATVTLSVRNIWGLKYDFWSSQQEWRYILQSLPISDDERISNDFSQILINNYACLKPVSLEYYDLRIDDKSLSEMEVMVGPRGNFEDVVKIVNKYCVSIKVIKSDYYGTIR
jgi:hypothetical protein